LSYIRVAQNGRGREGPQRRPGHAAKASAPAANPDACRQPHEGELRVRPISQ
jgi:hypothetical protein